MRAFSAKSLFLALGPLLAIACKGASDEGDTSDLALVSSVDCSVARGAFVSKASLPNGELTVTCPAVHGVTFNGDAVPGETVSTFKVKPHEGINILHVERTQGEENKVSDISFLYGTFSDPNAFVPNAIVLRAGAAGLSSNGTMSLPLPAGPTAVNLSQVASQVLRDQKNLLERFDGTGPDVSGPGFKAAFKIIHSSYDAQSVTVVVTPRAGGLHVEASVAQVASKFAWDAGLTIFQFHDEVDVAIAKISVSADINLAYDPATKKIRPMVGEHDLHVEGVEFDSAALNRIPELGKPIEAAIASGAKAFINNFADPVFDLVKDRVTPALAVSLDQLKLPSQITIPKLGGPLNIAQSFDGALFEADASQVSLSARVSAPNPNAIVAPGWLTRPTGAPVFDKTRAFGASVSVDYINQALFAGWKQGLLNREVSGPVSISGISTEAITSDAKLPPVIFPAADGKGLMVNVGELHLTTVFHSTTLGDAKVRFAVTLLAGANIALGPGGETLIVKPNKDDAHTKFVAQLIGVPEGKQEAADELAGILTLFTPVIESMISQDFDLPPIAIPAIDLGIVTPSFAGRKAGFDGVLRFDAAASRIGVDGELIAR